MFRQVHQAAMIGAGGWGTTLAKRLQENGHQVRMWAYEAVEVENITRQRVNTRFLPGVVLPAELMVSTDMQSVVQGASLIVMACPSQVMRAVARQLRPFLTAPSVVVSVAKGIENATLRRMSEVLAEELPPFLRNQIATLSGPSHAEEVARNIPTVVVAASVREKVAQVIQEAFMGDLFRVYTSTDVVGVELAGAMKNVIALAAGIVDGLGYGDNTKGALLTRGLAEMTRLGEVLGAEAATFAGLAGMGDLITTCMSRHSRNRHVGEQIGAGRTLEEVLAEMVMVAEGVRTTQSAVSLGRSVGVDLPICEEVHRILFEGKTAGQGVRDLMARPPRPEIYR